MASSPSSARRSCSRLILGERPQEQEKVLSPLVTKLATKCLAGG